MYCAVSRQEWAASAVTTAFSRSTPLSSSFTWVTLRSVVRDPGLPDDHLLVVQHRGEELDLAVQDAAQPLAVDRDRGQRLVQPARVRQGAEPPAGEVVQQVRADRLDEGADPSALALLAS
jgi:hypothetical protein